MIQRIQNVYLFLVALLSFACLFSTIGYYTVEDVRMADFSNFTFNGYEMCAKYDSTGPWCLGVLLIMVVFLNGVSLMLFKYRMRQLRLTILSTLLLIGYVAAYIAFAYFYHCGIETVVGEDVSSFHIRFTALFPVVSIILNALAISGIRKDEALVRSLDRLR